MVKLSAIIKRNPKIISRAIENQTFILDAENGEIRSLNEVASFIWKLAEKKVTVSQIIERICSEYEVKPTTAKKDTMELVEKYLERGLFKQYQQ